MDEGERQLRQLRQIEEMKPRKGLIILIIPIFSVIGVLILYVGTWGYMVQGRAADGERTTLVFDTCVDAKDVLSKRVASMGLGDPVFETADDRVSLTVTLPSEPDVAARIPGTLAMPGVLTSHRLSNPETSVLTNEDVVSAAMRQDLTLIPWTVLTLNERGLERLTEVVVDQRDDKVVYQLDGTWIGTVSNLKGANREVELTPEGSDDRDRMHKAAERTVVLDSGPIPCPIRLLDAP